MCTVGSRAVPPFVGRLALHLLGLGGEQPAGLVASMQAMATAADGMATKRQRMHALFRVEIV